MKEKFTLFVNNAVTSARETALRLFIESGNRSQNGDSESSKNSCLYSRCGVYYRLHQL